MAPTASLNPTQRFIPQGTSRYYWLPTIAAETGIPTRTELDAGTDLTGEVAVITGFSTTGGQVDTPDAMSRFTKRIPGPITADDSSITFYGTKDPTGEDVRSLLTRDQTGYLVILDSGDVEGALAEAFQVVVISVSKMREITGAFQVVVSFSIAADPVEFPVPVAP
jgi:hypothetical protein